MSSSEFKENTDDASVSLTTQNLLVDWKRIIVKLWYKEPELLLNLLKDVLDMIETHEDMKCEGCKWQLFYICLVVVEYFWRCIFLCAFAL